MKKQMLLMLVLIFLVLQSIFAQSKRDSTFVTISLNDKLSNSIPDCKFIIQNIKDIIVYTGITDKNGHAELKLHKGEKYSLIVPEIYQTQFSNTFEVPKDADFLNYTFNLTLSKANKILPKNENSWVTLILQTQDEKLLSHQKFNLFHSSGKLLQEETTDSAGSFILQLKKGERYRIETKINTMKLFTDFKVPMDMDEFIFRFLISINSVGEINEKDAAQENQKPVVVAEKQEGFIEPVKLKIRVTDENNVSEESAKINLFYQEKLIYSCTTDIDGYCYTNVDQKKDYEVKVEKFGKVFPFKLNMPKDKVLSEYTLEIVIKVITSYIRTYTLENVYFDFDKWNIRQDALPALEGLLEELKRNPKMKIEIAGHTDSDGPDDYNMRLSQLRANAVMTWLIQHGIAAGRLLAKGYGETQPIETNDTSEGRQKNRRTEVRVIEE